MLRKLQSFCLLLLPFALPAVCQTAPASPGSAFQKTINSDQSFVA